MAVDVKKYCYLLDPLFQVENIAGKPAVGGHIEVFHAGTDTPYITYQNFDGTHNPFKIPLNNDGRAVILAEPYYTYDVYCYDSFNNMICSRLNVQPQVGGDVSVSGFTEVWHDDTLSGEGTPESPLTVIGGGGSGKTYSGIDPIVVNNDEDKISANTVPFGVQEPLYFVEDETATIIGISGNPSADAVNWVTAQGYLQRPDLIGYATKDFVEEEVSGKYDTSAFSTISGAFLTALPEGSMNESAFGYSGGLITSYNGSAFKAGDEFPQSATEAILVVTANSGKWNDTFTALTSKSAVWDTVTNKLDESAFSSVSGDFQTTAGMTAYQPAGDYLTTGDSSNFYTTANESGFITGVDLTPYQTTAGMTAYASKDDVSGLQSASVWNDAVNTVSSNSASWTGIEYTGVSPIVVDNTSRSISADTWSVTFGSGLSAIDDTANSATTIVVTAQGGGGASMPITGTATVDGINYSGSYAADQATVMRLNSTGGTANAGGFTPFGFSATGGTSPYYQNYVSYNKYFLEKQGGNTTQFISATVENSNPGILLKKTASDNTVTSGLLDISSINSWNDVTATVSDNSASWTSTPITFPLNVTGQNVYVAKNTDTDMPASAVANSKGLSSYFIVDAGRPRQIDYTGIANYNGLELETVEHYTNKTAGASYSVTGISLSDNNSTGNIGIESIQNWNSTHDTVSANSASWGTGASYTGDAQGALDEVYSKSGDWNTVTDKLNTTAFSTVSGNFLTAHQALPNSANWDTTYTTVSTNSADWNSAAAMNELPVSAGQGMDIQNVDGNIVFSCTGGSVPEGVLVESGLEYNANNEISGYSGSAFAQPSISAAEWNSNYETVNTNSGAWGGDALPISAGPGVKMNVVNDTLVFSNDETVLYSGTTQTSAITFSEPLTAFERILVAAGQVSVGNWGYTYLINGGSNTYYAGFTRFAGGNNPVQIGGCVLNVNSQHTSGNLNPCGRHWFPTTTAVGGGDTNQFYFTKVIGINRTAGGN